MNSGSLPEKGFTLLEVMVALVIIATAFVVLLHSRNQSVMMAGYALHVTEATLLASQRLGEIQEEGFPEPGEDEGNFGEESSGYAWKSVVSTTPYEFVREVKVSVLWGKQAGGSSVDLVSYVRESK